MKALALLPALAALLVVQAGITLTRQTPPVPDAQELSAGRPAYEVVVPVADVHSAPEDSSPVIMQIPRPAVLYASGQQQPAWRYVSGVNWQGWVAAGDLTPETFLVPAAEPIGATD